MKNLILVVVASFVLGGCVSNGRPVGFETYELPKYSKPFVNEVFDSTFSIVRTGAKGAINRKVLRETGKLFY